jgi:hypothetical protein
VARVDADPNVEVDIGQRRSEALHGVDDVEAGEDSALRIIFVGNRRAEERQQAIAHEPGDRSLVSMDGRRHPLEGAVHDLGPVFWIEPFGEAGGVHHVDEQDREEASFAAHSSGLPRSGVERDRLFLPANHAALLFHRPSVLAEAPDLLVRARHDIIAPLNAGGTPCKAEIGKT